MAKRVIVGLGNPGEEYEVTRHNAGFMAVDRVSQEAGIEIRREGAGSLLGEGSYRGRALALAKPLTFMNRSGQAVQALLRRYGLTPSDLLIVYDDIALPIGQIRLRTSGGAGGHNGIQDIIDRVNSTDFPRLRIGVGNSFPRGGQVRYLLSPFEEDERDEIDAAFDLASEAALTFVREGMVTAMNRYNRR
ncbi:aminoacyl-tRNA hydrolase [soil metagenome]